MGSEHEHDDPPMMGLGCTTALLVLVVTIAVIAWIVI